MKLRTPDEQYALAIRQDDDSSHDGEKNKLNCWEFKECGREPGGRTAALFGVCSAAAVHQADGIHGGENGGRCCWFVATASLCKSERQESNAKKVGSCHSCDFYSMVKKEEHPRFILRHLRVWQTSSVQKETVLPSASTGQL